MSRLYIRAVLYSLVWFVFLGALLFWPAGTLAFPGAWVLMFLFVAGGTAITTWLAKHSPQLLEERLGSPVQRDQKAWDRIWTPLFILGFLAWFAFMGWDAARTGFTAVPVWGQVLGALGFIGSLLAGWWTFRANTFAAPVVKIQQDHKVIDTGPYAVVRHPMYAGAMLLFVGVPLLLGSLLGLLVAPVLMIGMAWRAVQEEKVLRRELPGYDSYARRVRYRLLPGIW